METFWRDLRFTLRSLSRSPATTSWILLILAIGIGATTAILSVINAVLVVGLPYENPDRLVLLVSTEQQDADVEDLGVSHLDFVDWREQRSDAFSALAAYSSIRSFHLRAEGEIDRVRGEMITDGYFELLRIEPRLGRAFAREETEAGAAQRLVILSHDLWQSRFAGDETIVGSTMLLNDENHQVLGVMPPNFKGLTDNADLWIPLDRAGEVLGQHYLEMRQFRWLNAVGRLAPGYSVEQAASAMASVAASLARTYPDSNESVNIRLVTLADDWFGDLRMPLFALLGGALFVLLIACNNVANLLLARAATRQPEVAMRMALGAGRSRLLVQLLVESLVLALSGAGLGLLLANWTTELLVNASSAELGSFVEIGIEPGIVAVVVALALLSGLVFGLAPAWMQSRIHISATLRESGGPGTSGGVARRFGQRLLIIAQVALALVLLLSAGMMLRDFQRHLDRDLGFEANDLYTLRIDLKGERYATDEPVWNLVHELLENLQALPGVDAAALSGPAIPTDASFASYFTIEDRRDSQEDGVVVLPAHTVTPGFFSTLKIPLLQGRDFDFTDVGQTDWVVVVSQAMAERYWLGDSEIIGKRIKVGPRDSDFPWMTVVGLAGNVLHSGLTEAASPEHDIYVPMLQITPRMPPRINILTRPAAGLEAVSLAPVLRETVKKIAPDLPPYDGRIMRQRLGRQTSDRRFAILLTGLFAGLALLLAVLGIYSVVSYSVARRTREIGVRMAFGASRRSILGDVLFRSTALTLIGLLVGLLATVGIKHFLDRLFYDLSSVDAWAWLPTPILLLGVALLASLFPALRAAQINPRDALNFE